MCIIVYKDNGVVLPNKRTLQNCFENNSDGAGYMLRLEDNRILIRKGFMQFNDLWNSLMSIDRLTDKELCIHFRYATHGDKSPGNTHPFPVTRKINTLRRLRTVCECGIVHNGVVSNLTHVDKTLSDTMCMVKRIVTEGEMSADVQATLLAGKFIVMDETETRIYGKFISDESGVMYSNDGYMAIEYIYTQYKGYDKWSNAWYGSEDVDCDMIEEYNKQYGTDFLTWDEVEAHIDMMEICEDCIWYQELIGQCYVTKGPANPESPHCSFSPWLRKDRNEQTKLLPEHVNECIP